MSLQWTLIAGFLYVEIVIVLLLVLPVASPKRWNRLFKSRFLQVIQQQAGFYFVILLSVLVLFLLDAIREIRKYSNIDSSDHQHHHLDSEMQGNMRLFRAQRNFYIAGFSLFLSLVIRRLITLISAQAALLAQSEAALKQAESASKAARSFLSKNTEVAENVSNEAHDEEVTILKNKIEELEDKLNFAVKDKLAMKQQAENLSKQYDSLAEEHSKLQKKLTASGDNDGKKDD